MATALARPTTVDLTELPSLTNNAFYPLYGNRDRYLVLYGGAGSGKSVFAAQKIVVRLLSEPGHRFLVVRKVGKTIRNSAFAQIREIIASWGLEELFKVTKSDLEIQCANGGQVVCVGLDDAEKLKSIVGITGLWIEEATEITPEDFQQLDLRLRGRTRYYKQIMLTFNPVSALSWIKSRFFDVPQANATVLKTTHADNKWLDDEYRAVLEGLKDKDYVYYQVYALGEWGVLGNLIFTNWTVDESVPTSESSYKQVYCGLDFGFNDPSAFVKVGLKDDELCVFEELYERGLTNNELIPMVRESHVSGAITADSSEPARIKEFQQAGVPVRPAEKGPGSVKAGLDWAKRKRIRIHPSCTNFIAEIQGYKYREDKDGNVFDEPVGINDHLMSAFRYALEPLRKGQGIEFLR